MPKLHALWPPSAPASRALPVPRHASPAPGSPWEVLTSASPPPQRPRRTPPTKTPPSSDSSAHPLTKAHPSSCPEPSGRTSSAVSCDVSPTYTTTVLNGDWLNVDSVTEGPQDTLRSVCSARQRAIHPGPGGFRLQLPHQPHTVFATTHSFIPRTCQAWAEGEPMPPPRDLEAQLPPARGEATSPPRPPATAAARLVGRRGGGNTGSAF